MSITIKLNPPTLLTHSQKRHLRTLGHRLNAIVQIGKFGITPTLIEALKQALARHELVKVSINGESPTEREVAASSLVKAVGAHLVQMVGRTLILYRAKDENPVIVLPKATKAKDQNKGKKQSQSVSTPTTKPTTEAKKPVVALADDQDDDFDDDESFEIPEFSEDDAFEAVEFGDDDFDDDFDDDDLSRLNAYQNQGQDDDDDWGQVIPKERMQSSPKVKQERSEPLRSTQKPSTDRPSRPGSSRPGSSRPGSSRPGSSRPGSSRPGSSRPGSSKPGSSRPGSSKPGSSKPGSSRPGSSKSGPFKPGSRKPTSSRPTSSRSSQRSKH
jgi:RNA-binding protein